MGCRDLSLDMSEKGWRWQHQVEPRSPSEADEEAVSLPRASDAPILRYSPWLVL